MPANTMNDTTYFLMMLALTSLFWISLAFLACRWSYHEGRLNEKARADREQRFKNSSNFRAAFDSYVKTLPRQHKDKSHD